MEQIHIFVLRTTPILTGSLGPGNKSLPNVSDIKHRWRFDIIPVLFGERVNPSFKQSKKKKKITNFYRLSLAETTPSSDAP